MKRFLLGCLALIAFAFPAQAQTNKVGQQLLCDGANANTTTITVKDAAGATQTFDVVTGGTARCASVGTAGSPSTNALTVQSVTIGNGTSANAARVTLSNDSTGVVAATQSGAWNITNITGTVSLPTGAATAANQGLLTTWAGGTLGAMANYGTSPGAVLVPGVNASVTASALPTGAATSANQTNATQKTQVVDGSGNVIASTSNNLNVQCANCSGSGVSTADISTFTPGPAGSLFAGGGGFFQTTATSNPLANNQQGMFQLTAQRALFTNLRNSSGTEIATAGAPLQVSVANTAANGTAMLVTGTGGTFPIATWAGGTLGAMANYGTSPGAVLVPGMNAFVTNAPSITNITGTVSLPTGAATAANQTSPLFASTQNTASPTNAFLAGGQFNTTPTTITTGNTSPLQLDNAGNLLVNVKAGGASGGTSSNFGSAFPTPGTAVGFTDGTNMQAGVIKAASTAAAATDRSIVVALSPNSPAKVFDGTNTATVKAASTAPVATDTAFVVGVSPNSGIADGTANSSINGSKIQGLASTVCSTPTTYTNNQINPVTLDLKGNTCTDLFYVAGTALGTPTNFGTGPGAVVALSANASMFAGTTALTQTGAALDINIKSGSLAANQSVNVAQFNGVTPLMGNGVSGTGSQRVNIASDNTPFGISQVASTPVTGTLQSAAVANGNGTNLNTNGMSGAILTVNCATCSGGTTINFEGTEDATNYASINAVQLGTSTIAVSTAASGITVWQMPIAGLQNIRARISAYSAGTVTVTGHTVPVTYDPKIVNANIVANTATNQSVNLAQVSGTTLGTPTNFGTTPGAVVAASANASLFIGTVAAASGNGVSGTGTQRVNIASDNTAFPVNAALTAGTANVGQVGGSVNITPTDCSIALTTGNTAQNIITAGATLHGFTIANIDTAAGSGEPVWMSFTGTAVASATASYPLAAPTATTFAGLSSYTTPLGFGTNANVSVIAATTGHKISCTKW